MHGEFKMNDPIVNSTRPDLLVKPKTANNNNRPGAYVIVNGQPVPDLNDSAMVAIDASKKKEAKQPKKTDEEIKSK